MQVLQIFHAGLYEERPFSVKIVRTKIEAEVLAFFVCQAFSPDFSPRV